jgi:hypothetical protein
LKQNTQVLFHKPARPGWSSPDKPLIRVGGRDRIASPLKQNCQ